MRVSVTLLTIAGTIAGAAAAVVTYQSAASVDAPAKPAAVTSQVAVNQAPVTRTKWLPCKHGWKLKGKTCVRVKEKVVVVHDIPAPAVEPVRTAPVRSSSGSHHAVRRPHVVAKPRNGAGSVATQTAVTAEQSGGHEHEHDQEDQGADD